MRQSEHMSSRHCKHFVPSVVLRQLTHGAGPAVLGVVVLLLEFPADGGVLGP